MSDFNINQIPNQPGKVAIVTGANTGLGLETAKALVQKEMKVIMACRNLEKGNKAKNDILREVPQAALAVLEIDLSKLASVRHFADTFLTQYDRLDLLINNAGVMMPPYQKTEDGFELQMAANYFGHFLLTGLLIDTIMKTPASRVVSLSSISHKNATINFNDLQSESDYSKSEAYGQSKLACLLFAKELQRRLDRYDHGDTLSLAAHPGVSNTDLSRHFPKWLSIVATPMMLLLTHPPERAARPTLLAALGTDVEGGEYYGPQGFKEMKGEPGKAQAEPQAKDEWMAKKLWEVSEQLTDIRYNFTSATTT